MLTHFNSLGNPFFMHLEEAQKAKISARQRYGQLLDTLKDKGVAFKDIEAHMINEAKRCSLYRKNHWSDKDKTFVYMPISILARNRINWYVCLSNFLNWVKANYADYDLTLTKKIMGDSSILKHKRESAARREGTAIIRKTDSTGNVTESTVTVQGATVREVTQSVPEEIVVNQSPVSLTGPVTAPTLTLLEVQQVILQNFSVLGKIAQAKGASAVDAFNALMLELGMTEELL